MFSVKPLMDFDSKQLFRFFVDGRFHKKYRGWRGYEDNEPGSVKGMLNAYSYMIDNFDLGGGLKAGYIRDLHKACMSNVITKNPKSQPGEMRYLEAGFLFYSANSTLDSLKDIFEQRRHDGTPLFHTRDHEKTADELDAEEAYRILQERKSLRYRPWYPKLNPRQKDALDLKDTLEAFYTTKHYIQVQYARKIDALVAEFNAAIINADTDQNKLLLISRLVRNLELLHPFPDGNGRTFIAALMNHLLLYYGFFPAILNDPNIDAEYSAAEFAEEMKRGMENTRLLIGNPTATLFNYSISEASDRDIAEFLALSKEFRDKLAALYAAEKPQQAAPATDTAQGGVYLNPENLARITGGTWSNCDPNLRFKGVGSHKTFKSGYLYFGLALPEWRKEGKDPVAEIDAVFKKGIAAIVLDDEALAKSRKEPVLLVRNIEKAFLDAATATRREVGCKAVLVTGTVGKTGMKVQLFHCLKGQAPSHAALNSANTKVPVLWSLANLKPEDEVEINEVSVGGGENIGAERSKWVSPDICVFTNIGPNHMDIHGTVDNLVRAKASVIDGLREGGVCIVNSCSDYYQELLAAIRKRRDVPILTFGTGPGDTARVVEATFDGVSVGWNVIADIEGETVRYFVPMLHKHAPVMSVGLLLTVKRLGYDVQRAARDYLGLQPFETMGNVFRIQTGQGSFLFYDQSRRGGIQGMRSAFDDLRRLRYDGKLVAVVGGVSIKKDDEWTRAYHEELAQLVDGSKIDRLYTTGQFMHYMHDKLSGKNRLIKHSDDLAELETLIRQDIAPGDLLFIIGSAYLYLGRLAAQVYKFGELIPLSQHQRPR